MAFEARDHGAELGEILRARRGFTPDEPDFARWLRGLEIEKFDVPAPGLGFETIFGSSVTPKPLATICTSVEKLVIPKVSRFFTCRRLQKLKA